MIAAVYAATLAALLLVPAVARAESWILWYQEFNGQYPKASLVRTVNLGVFPASAPCAVAAREQLTDIAQAFRKHLAENKAPGRAGFTIGPASQTPVQATTNPPGARVETTHMTRLYDQPAFKELFIFQTQCWPAGVNPR